METKSLYLSLIQRCIFWLVRPSRSRIEDPLIDSFFIQGILHSKLQRLGGKIKTPFPISLPNALAVAWSSPDISIISSSRLGSKGDIDLWFKFNVECRLFSYLCFTLSHIEGVRRRQPKTFLVVQQQSEDELVRSVGLHLIAARSGRAI